MEFEAEIDVRWPWPMRRTEGRPMRSAATRTRSRGSAVTRDEDGGHRVQIVVRSHYGDDDDRHRLTDRCKEVAMRLLRWLGVTAVAATVVSGSVVSVNHPASAQPAATVSLSKTASVSSVAPGTPFTYFLDYSCSSLTTTCNGVTITDVLPAQLSLAAADVTLVGTHTPPPPRTTRRRARRRSPWSTPCRPGPPARWPSP